MIELRQPTLWLFVQLIMAAFVVIKFCVNHKNLRKSASIHPPDRLRASGTGLAEERWDRLDFGRGRR